MTCEALGRRKDGSEVALEVTATDFDLDGERLFLWIMRDITERKKVDRLKNEFVSVVSHELRTPLTSIIGSLGLLNAGVMGQVSAQAQEMLSIAQNNGERLVRLINDILDVEKIESGQLAFSEQAVDLGEVTLQAVDANRGLGEKYAVSFVVEQPLRAAWVQGDADRLIQVLTNLLSNAAKYSPERGVVRVGMARQNGFLRVWVRDQGPGIPEDFQDRIFEKFAQVDSSDTRQKDGTGLGLSIARSIVELHGGHIGFNSSSGAGTEFYFDLPEYRQQQATAS
jgi:signal transduction histidine kinase